MKAASGEFFALLLVLCHRGQVSSQRFPPVFAQTVSELTRGQTHRPRQLPGKMLDHPASSLEAERAIPTVARQRQFQIG